MSDFERSVIALIVLQIATTFLIGVFVIGALDEIRDILRELHRR